MFAEPTGRYTVSKAQTTAELSAAFALRSRVFRGDASVDDRDAWDDTCDHYLVCDATSGDLRCYFRLQIFERGAQATHGYSSQFFDLQKLSHFSGTVIEVGRFCTDSNDTDPDVLRIAWAAITRAVDDHNATFLFGCSSFSGVALTPYIVAFNFLANRFSAPDTWAPEPKGETAYRLSDETDSGAAQKAQLSTIPPLLRTYTLMGGRVGSHAVVDPDLGNLVVFTGLDVSQVPPKRAAALRSLASGY